MPGRDVTKNFVRNRQFAPSNCASSSFRVKQVNSETKLVICCPTGHWNRKKQRCKVGTRVQSILKKRK